MQETTLSIRLSKKEKATIEKLAQLENKTITNFVKSKIFAISNDEVSHAKHETNDREFQILKLIAILALRNNGTLKKAVSDRLTEEDKKQINDDANDVLEKLLQNK